MKDVFPKIIPKVGQWVNETREAIEAKIKESKKKLTAAELEHRLEHEVIDVTLACKEESCWPSSSKYNCIGRSRAVFSSGMGYEVVEGTGSRDMIITTSKR